MHVLYHIITFVFLPPRSSLFTANPFQLLFHFSLSFLLHTPSAIPVRSAVFTESRVIISAHSLVNLLSLTLSGTAQPFVPALFLIHRPLTRSYFLFAALHPQALIFSPSPPPLVTKISTGLHKLIKPSHLNSIPLAHISASPQP